MQQRKRISSREAARILGVTLQTVRNLGKAGVLSHIDIPAGKTVTHYYFEDEVKARKANVVEYTHIVEDTEAKLENARSQNAEAARLEEDAARRLRSSRDYIRIVTQLTNILESCFLAVEKVYPLTERERSMIEDLIRLQPMNKVASAYGVTTERLRQICVKALRKLIGARSIAEQNEALARENRLLVEENKKLKAANTLIRENSVTLKDDQILVLSEYDYNRREIVLSSIDALRIDWYLEKRLRENGITTVLELVSKTREEYAEMGIDSGYVEEYLSRASLSLGMNLAPLGIGNNVRLGQIDKLGSPEGMSPGNLSIKNKLMSKVRNYGLSVRAYNCLRFADIETFADLVQYRREEIFRLRNFGRKSLREIDNMLEKVGLSFGMDPRRYGVIPNKKIPF